MGVGFVGDIWGIVLKDGKKGIYLTMVNSKGKMTVNFACKGRRIWLKSRGELRKFSAVS